MGDDFFSSLMGMFGGGQGGFGGGQGWDALMGPTQQPGQPQAQQPGQDMDFMTALAGLFGGEQNQAPAEAPAAAPASAPAMANPSPAAAPAPMAPQHAMASAAPAAIPMPPRHRPKTFASAAAATPRNQWADAGALENKRNEWRAPMAGGPAFQPPTIAAPAGPMKVVPTAQPRPGWKDPGAMENAARSQGVSIADILAASRAGRHAMTGGRF
jgi:hypothetical protein